jgi:hypothetical protein
MPPLFPPPREGGGDDGRDGGGVEGRSGRVRRPFDDKGGPWSEDGVSDATGGPEGLRRPAPPREPRRVRGRGVSAAVSVSAAAVGSLASAAAAGSGSDSAAGVASASVEAALARDRERPAPPRVPRRARGRGASSVESSLEAAGASSAAGVSVVVGASASVEAAVVRLVRPPRRLGFSSAADSSAGALSGVLPPCRDRFRKDSHSEITRSPQGNFVRCIAQRFSLRLP